MRASEAPPQTKLDAIPTYFAVQGLAAKAVESPCQIHAIGTCPTDDPAAFQFSHGVETFAGGEGNPFLGYTIRAGKAAGICV